MGECERLPSLVPRGRAGMNSHDEEELASEIRVILRNSGWNVPYQCRFMDVVAAHANKLLIIEVKHNLRSNSLKHATGRLLFYRHLMRYERPELVSSAIVVSDNSYPLLPYESELLSMLDIELLTKEMLKERCKIV